MATEKKTTPEGKLIRWATAIGYAGTVAVFVIAIAKRFVF